MTMEVIVFDTSNYKSEYTKDITYPIFGELYDPGHSVAEMMGWIRIGDKEFELYDHQFSSIQIHEEYNFVVSPVVVLKCIYQTYLGNGTEVPCYAAGKNYEIAKTNLLEIVKTQMNFS